LAIPLTFLGYQAELLNSVSGAGHPGVCEVLSQLSQQRNISPFVALNVSGHRTCERSEPRKALFCSG
jgi:hypothetical protein